MRSERGYRVLLVGNEQQLQFGRNLLPSSTTISRANTLDEALDLVDQLKPDLIVFEIDNKNPQNSLLLIHQVRSNIAFDTMMLLGIVRAGSDELLLRCLENGTNDYIRPDFSPAQKVSRIESLLRMRKAYSDLEEINSKSRKQNMKFRKYFARDLHYALLAGNVPSDIGGETREISVMMVNIRQATQLIETMPPHDFADLINTLYVDLADLIFGNSGSINKFTGRNLLITFGAPEENSEHRKYALQSIDKIHHHVDTMNQMNLFPVKLDLDIGVATGPLFIGNIGSANKLDFTILGDAVNTAARLASLCESLGRRYLISEATLAEKKSHSYSRVETQIRGKLNQLAVYSQ